MSFYEEPKAFPVNTEWDYGGEQGYKTAGMNLRDYFAAKAMPMVFKFTKNCIENDGGIFEIGDVEREKDMSSQISVVAEFCYIFADAMMEARK
jgi:hypothetical protein